VVTALDFLLKNGNAIYETAKILVMTKRGSATNDTP